MFEVHEIGHRAGSSRVFKVFLTYVARVKESKSSILAPVIVTPLSAPDTIDVNVDLSATITVEATIV